MKLFFLITSFVLALGSPLNGCSLQSDCLSVDISGCSPSGERQVCLEWNPGPSCLKSPSGTISHACPGSTGDKDYNNDGLEAWPPGDVICETVTGGQAAIFGVKDGSTCSDTGVFTMFDDSGANAVSTACIGPLNVCSGGNVKECQWAIPTESCTTSTSSVCGNGDVSALV